MDLLLFIAAHLAHSGGSIKEPREQPFRKEEVWGGRTGCVWNPRPCLAFFNQGPWELHFGIASGTSPSLHLGSLLSLLHPHRMSVWVLGALTHYWHRV